MDNFYGVFESVRGVFLAVLFFGGTIFVHELGHFLAAKKRGLKIERFSIGFGPRVWGRTGKDGVDYRLSLFPLGGYVALPQLADMSAIEGETNGDSEKLPKISFADKVIVAVMGAVFNVLFACVIACVLWVIGVPERASTREPIIGHVPAELETGKGDEKVPSPAFLANLKPGDRIISIDGKKIGDWNDAVNAIILGTDNTPEGAPLAKFVIERDGATLPEPLIVHPALTDRMGTGDLVRTVCISNADPIILSVDAKRTPPPAIVKAGLKTGDRILEMNGVKLWSSAQFAGALALINDDTPATFLVQSDGEAAPRKVAVVADLAPPRNPRLALEFDDAGVRRSVELVASPEHPDFNSEKSFRDPRTALMVCNHLSDTSSFAGKFPVGAVIESVAGVATVTDFDAVIAAIQRKGGDIEVRVRDGGATTSVSLKAAKVSPIFPERERRFSALGLSDDMELVRRPPWEHVGKVFSLTFGTLKALFSPGSNLNLSHMQGVVGIASTYYSISDNIRGVLWLTLLINVNLAVMNLLPFPVLDGGHIVYAILEKLRGKSPPKKVLEVVQTVFVLLLFGLMAFVTWQDFRRNIRMRDDVRQFFVERLVMRDSEGTETR